jgi:hypothetical protein
MSFRPPTADPGERATMRMARTGVVLVGVLVVTTTVVGASAAAAAPASGAVSWSPPLTGEAAGIVVSGRTARLGADHAPGAARADGHGDARAPGLLTLPARHVDAPVDRVDATLALATGRPAAAASIDVRGRRSSGQWTEWEPVAPADRRPSATTRALTATLPDPVDVVQARLVLTPSAGAGPGPVVRGLTLTAHPATRKAAAAKREPRRDEVFATREGLVGGTTANGHVVTEKDLFVALPSRRALAPRDSSDYSVKVCAPTGRCAFAPVWDVGPWNTRDDYWNPPEKRQEWRDLPPGLPQAQAAKQNGHNGGKDQFGRTVLNPAGIDLADGMFWDALGLTDNAWVTVEYLWTGDSPLGTVQVDGRADLRSGPDAKARVVGLAADRAAVPLQCVSGSWLRVGTGQFLPASAVPRRQWPRPLPTCPR